MVGPVTHAIVGYTERSLRFVQSRHREDWSMNEATTLRFVGLDVHRDSIAIAVAQRDGKPAESLATVPNDVAGLIKRLQRLGPVESLRCCYEAGPTGFGLARRLNTIGIACEVIAPSLVPVQPGARVKTDRRDARNLAHYLRSGDLTSIHVLDPITEAIRDLERARDDAKRAERSARQQLSKFLLRHERWFTGKSTWGPAHQAWLVQQRFDQPAQQDVMNDYREAVEMATARVARLTKQMAERSATWERAPLVTALQALRGVEMVSAVTLVAEIGDFRRFASASELMSFVGLVPSEHSSGGSRRQGRITRTGNGHVRRILVESAWHYRRQPRMSKAIRARTERVSVPVRAIAWKAQQRLHKRLNRLMGQGKPATRAVTAVARELVGFVWAIAREEVLLES
jgi:transposase